MTPDVILVFSILAVAVLLLVTEWIPMEVTALLSLGAVALTGLVSPIQALSGFSNPAVVTVWATAEAFASLHPLSLRQVVARSRTWSRVSGTVLISIVPWGAEARARLRRRLRQHWRRRLA